MTNDETTAIISSAPYQELERQHRRVATLLTLLTVAAYFAFIFLMAFAPDILAQRVGGVVLGIPFGIGVILWSWLLTGIYTRWANTTYDALVAQVKATHNSDQSRNSGDQGEVSA